MHIGLITLFSFLIGICNMIGGRLDDVYGTPDPFNGRLIFRCVIPGIASGLFANELGFDILHSVYAWLAVTAGSALWFCFGWSFDEVTGLYDPDKYPRWIQWIGTLLVPITVPASTTASSSRNKLRGVIMKGFRGLFDIATFALLMYLNPHAIYLLPVCATMGAVYWFAGVIAPAGKGVLFAEFMYGCIRGLNIALGI